MVNYEFKKFHQLNTQELYDLLQLRSAVFVVEQDCVYQDLDNLDQKAIHLLGYDEKKNLVAYARILPENIPYPKCCSIGRIISSRSMRGKGLGKAVMKKSLSYCAENFKGIPIKIMAQYYLLDFYRSFGFEAVGEKFLEDGIWHIDMVSLD
ncbi:MAG: GNAT family N-acetyltransferase [Saprospirales bacterium]|nr:MAG: GNAT family N-acetyltransferase [Saprospirales bacterium]